MKGGETDTGIKIDDVELFNNETIDSLVTTVGLQRINPLEQLHRDMAHFDVRKSREVRTGRCLPRTRVLARFYTGD